MASLLCYNKLSGKGKSTNPVPMEKVSKPVRKIVVDIQNQMCYNKLSKEMREQKSCLLSQPERVDAKMANTKVTKRDQFNTILGIVAGMGREDLVDFVSHELDLLDKRAGAARKPTKDQLANEALKADMVGILGEMGALTATDLANTAGVSVQKATQLLKQLVTAGTVARIEGKGKEKTTFAVA